MQVSSKLNKNQESIYMADTVPVLLIYLSVISSVCMNAQNTQPKLNQVELMKQWIGTWHRNVSKDTIEVWEFKPFGKSMTMTNFHVVKGKRSDIALVLAGYDDRDDKIKGFWLSPKTNFVTWVGKFNAGKLFKGEVLDTFKPEIVWWKNEYETISSSELIVRTFDLKGVKTDEVSYTKVNQE